MKIRILFPSVAANACGPVSRGTRFPRRQARRFVPGPLDTEFQGGTEPEVLPGPGDQPGKRFVALLLLIAACLGLLVQARADWPNTNATKFVQLPNLGQTGKDIYFLEYPVVLADDFTCTNTGPVTDIHLWISSLFGAPVTGAQFELSVWDDVPADPANGAPSHPGNRLWHEVFNPGQYAVRLAATGLQEEFWNLEPAAPQFMGPDTNLFLYNFFPTQPFTQTGSISAPIIYWLGVSMNGDNPPQGWKTSTNAFAPDFAVLGHYPSGGGNVTDWRTLFDPRLQTVGLNFAFALTTVTNQVPPPECNENNGVKYVQPPQLDGGYDVFDSGPWVLADDFICTNRGPISDIHLWGSWFNDVQDPNPIFWLGIYDDVPAVTNGPVYIPSRPGTNLLWQQWFGPGDYAQMFWGAGFEQFLDPGPPAVMGPDTKAYYYCFNPTNAFIQQGTPANPTIYWLAVHAQTPAGTEKLFGWKTTQRQRFDISTHTQWPGVAPITTDWRPNVSENNMPLDLAFKLTTKTNPPTVCVETNGVKFIQPPQLDNGLAVWDSGPWVLADDFICTNTGPVSDIHLWGAWLRDVVDPNPSFWLAIYDDVPAGPGSPSHPGSLKWQQWFGPADYASSLWAHVPEGFYDPGPPAIISMASNVWYYCFTPTNAFVQQGSTSDPQIYWLLVYAQTSTANDLFGWANSTIHQFDSSVHGNWPGGPPPAAFPWQPTFGVTGAPLDLAFKLTTKTNECPPLTLICSNKTVECGSAWTLDPPTVIDPCCPAGGVSVQLVSVVTNGTCPKVITATWMATDCRARVASCDEIVTVVDTTAPVLSCPPAKTVECGSTWDFDFPSATDACCGTNVTIQVLNTVTNSAVPCQQSITRSWLAVDCCTNRAICSQTVTIVDTTPPTITCPPDIVVKTCGTNPVMVTWTITATDTCSSVTVTSSPPSGTYFLPPSTNVVVATATDACGNRSTCTFRVMVVRPVLGPISISLSGTFITLSWSDGILQEATNAVGPWSDVPGATPPAYTTSVLGPHKFYRLRCTSP